MPVHPDDAPEMRQGIMTGPAATWSVRTRDEETMGTIKPLLVSVLLASLAGAQPAPVAPAPDTAPPEPLDVLKGRPDAPAGDLLGDVFSSDAAGISFRAPAGMKQVGRPGSDQITQYVDEKRQWSLSVTRTTLKEPLALTSQTSTDPNPRPGLLELTRNRLKSNSPGVEIVREDVVNITDADVALLAARVGVGLKRVLVQQAIIQANDQLYYTISLSTPAARQNDDGTTPQDDPNERAAVEALRAMLDTVKILDRTAVKEDQNQRLYRTRALFVNIDRSRIEQALMPEQWVRIIHSGKDIGYSYIVEEPEKQAGHDGVSVGIRTRTITEPSPEGKPAAPTTRPTRVQRDSETLMWMSLDRKHETWSTVMYVDDGKRKDTSTEVGASDRQTNRVYDKELPVGEQIDPRNPPVRLADTYTLKVTTVGKRAGGEPIVRELPPFYMPMAMGHLLPRILPLEQPKTYMFASFVSDRGEVMARYVDVGREEDVELGGKKVRAVPVADRIGLEGSVTTHWVSPEGTYLGGINKDSGMTLLPTDAPTLQKMWQGADLSRPRRPEEVAPDKAGVDEKSSGGR
jgi:hypothetical protein